MPQAVLRSYLLILQHRGSQLYVAVLVGRQAEVRLPEVAHGCFLCAGWKGTWVCETDKHKALEMYKEWKAGKKATEAHH